MIRLRTDCLVFETADGGVPCPVEYVVKELLGEASAWMDPEILRQAAAGVLRYFRDDLGRESVTVEEFSGVLARVLRGFGLQVVGEATVPSTGEGIPLDLWDLVREPGINFELAFFPRLRSELAQRLARSPRVLRVHGLRACVKYLTSTQRWCPRCRRLHIQILSFLGECLRESAPRGGCALVVT